MAPITQLGGYNVIRLHRGQQSVHGIPYKIEGWHQTWWFVGEAWQPVDPTSPLGIRVCTDYAIRVKHLKYI